MAEDALRYLQNKPLETWRLNLVMKNPLEAALLQPFFPNPTQEASKTNLQASQPPRVVGSQINESQTQQPSKTTSRFPAPLLPHPYRFSSMANTGLQELLRGPVPPQTQSTQLQPPLPSQSQPPKTMGPPPTQIRPPAPSTQLQPPPQPSQAQAPVPAIPPPLPVASQVPLVPSTQPPQSTQHVQSRPAAPPSQPIRPPAPASQPPPVVQPVPQPSQAPVVSPPPSIPSSQPTSTQRPIPPSSQRPPVPPSQRPSIPSTQQPPEEPIFVPDSPEPERDKRKPAPPSSSTQPPKRRKINTDVECLVSSDSEPERSKPKSKPPQPPSTTATTNNNNNNNTTSISNNNNNSNSNIVQNKGSPSKSSQAIPSSQQREDNLCPICFDTYAITGSHRICCLKCGHLFGKSCIEKWLKTNKKCPSCNAKARTADIRLLYVNKITAVDSSEVQFAMQQVKKEQQARAKVEAEKQGVERELAVLQSKYNDLKKKMRDLQEAVSRQQVQLDQLGGESAVTTENVTPGPGAIQKLRMPSTRTKKSGPPLQKLPGFPSHPAPTMTSPVKPSKTECTNDVMRISSSPPCNNNNNTNNNSFRAFHNAINNTHPNPIIKHDITPPVSLSGLKSDSNTSNYFASSTVPSFPPSEAFHSKKHTYKVINKIDLQGARVLDWNGHEGLLVASSLKPGTVPNSMGASSYGITKISALDCANPDFILLHDKMIRDVKFQPVIQSALLMTTSLDKTLKLVNFKTNNVVHTFHLTSPAWACEWNAEDANYFYCGQQKSIVMFDIRKTDNFVCKFEAPHAHPTSSISFVSGVGSPSRNVRKALGLLTSSTLGVFFYDIDNDYKCQRLPFDGTCTHAGWDVDSGFFVASFRNTPSFSKPCHTVFELMEGPSVKELRTLHSDSCASISQQVLARSLIFSASTEGYLAPSQDHPSRVMVAAGDEKTFNVMLWDCTEGYLVEKLCSHASPVLDLKHFGDRSVNFLTSLSETQLFIHKLQ